MLQDAEAQLKIDYPASVWDLFPFHLIVMKYKRAFGGISAGLPKSFHSARNEQ